MQTIHFRSSREYSREKEGSEKKRSGRSPEYSDIREYRSDDDARDIAWWRSTVEWDIYTKSRDTPTGICISILWVRDEGWWFSLDREDRSKDQWYDTLLRETKESSRLSGYTYRENLSEESLEKTLEEYVKQKEKNTLLLVVTSSLDTLGFESLDRLAKHNDILVIHLFQTYEVRSEEWLLASSRRLWSSYFEAIEKKKQMIKKSLMKKGISYLSTRSLEDPATVLNNFFKQRYAR